MKLFKSLISCLLVRIMRKFFHNNPHIRLVAVVGSVGKTTTKSTIVDVLKHNKKVRTNRGNFNAEFSAPLEMLGIDGPKNPRSITNWLSTIYRAYRSARQLHDINVIVQEFGIDHPGEMTAFGRYAHPDILVVTAISPEHMEFFGNLKTVAQEEFALSSHSIVTLYNRDDINSGFIAFANSERNLSYSTEPDADYYITAHQFNHSQGYTCTLTHGEQTSREFIMPVVAKHQLRIAAGAAAVALEFNLDVESVITALENFTPVPGRMNLLSGINNSTIIDDSYNSSPLAAKSALETLYQLPGKAKIAVLGDMNELGDTTASEHRALGTLCDPAQLSHVITIGSNAATFLAPAAQDNGCTVTSFDTAIDAVELLQSLAHQDTVLLFKGSQGGVYLEEAIKPLLKSSKDTEKLVRQSKEWLNKKQAFFGKSLS